MSTPDVTRLGRCAPRAAEPLRSHPRAGRTGDGLGVLPRPDGSSTDMTDAIVGQIERSAPGFRDRVLAMHGTSAAALERYNPNYVGGDIGGGLQDLGQQLTRPAIRLDPYSTPDPSIFICSASTPPGGGVHGMAGYHAARSALRHRLGG